MKYYKTLKSSLLQNSETINNSYDETNETQFLPAPRGWKLQDGGGDHATSLWAPNATSNRDFFWNESFSSDGGVDEDSLTLPIATEVIDKIIHCSEVEILESLQILA